MGPRTPPEPEEEPEPEGEPEITDADSREIDFLKLIKQNVKENKGFLLSEIEDITRTEEGIYRSVNKLLERFESDNYTSYQKAFDSYCENQKKHNKDYTFNNNQETLVQKTKSDSKRTKETITITKPNYQRTTRLLKHLQNERDEVEYNLKVENSLALDESKKDKNLANLKKMKDAYFKLSEKIKLVNQYHEIVNNTIENKNRINNNNLQIGKNSAEKRLVFSEITQLMKTEPINQEQLDRKIKYYLSLGKETSKLRERIDEISNLQINDYMIIKEPSVSIKKAKETSGEKKEEKEKTKIKVKAKGAPKKKKIKVKGKMKGGGDKTKSLETVIQTIDLLENESSSESDTESEPELETETETVPETETEPEFSDESDTKKIVLTENENSLESKSDDYDLGELEEIDLSGGKKDTFKIDDLDLSDNLEELADYSDDSESDTGEDQVADFSSTYTSDSNDTLDTAESIPLNLNENINNSESESEVPQINVIKLGQ